MEESNTKTFVFSELYEDEKEKFMDFMIHNKVDFEYDPHENMYIATIKIVNKV